MRLRLATLGVSVIVFLLASMGLRNATPALEEGVFPLEPPTPYLHFIPNLEPSATALVVHGLNSNKEFMQTFAMALADAGVDTYVIDLPGHGDAPGPFGFDRSLGVVRGVLTQLETSAAAPIVIGHSMGASLLVELAHSVALDTVVLLSPAPIPVESFSVERLLIVTGSLDTPRINRFVPPLIDSARGNSMWWKFAHTAHSTALFDPRKIRQIVGWIVGGDEPRSRTVSRYGWLALMAAAGLLAPGAILGRKSRDAPLPLQPPASACLATMLVGYVAASGAAVVLLRFVNPLGWLGVYAGDYLMGLLLLAGLLLWRGRGFKVRAPGLVLATLSATYVIGVLLVGVGNHLLHLLPSGVQWPWFPVFTAASLPLFLYDCQVLCPIPSAWKRWAMFLVTRVILWSATVTGVLLLSPRASFLVLIMHFIVLFWLLLWGMMEIVVRLGGEPRAAALFAALIQGWVLAALSVRI